MRRIQREIVGAFIFSSDQKLLLGKSHKGGVYQNAWIVPGGGIDDGETKLEALKREMLEETGIDITSAKITEIEGALNGESEKTLRDSGERVLVEMHFYNFLILIDDTAKNIEIETDDDFQQARWFSKEELQSLSFSPPTTTTLKKMGYL
jgi:8-oxo-dGTP diphosphatase